MNKEIIIAWTNIKPGISKNHKLMTFHFIFIKTRSIFRFLVPNRIVKIRNKQYSYDYQAEADLLRRDWESALERHSDRHPITYNRCIWMTTSHARKVLNLSKKHV